MERSEYENRDKNAILMMEPTRFIVKVSEGERSVPTQLWDEQVWEIVQLPCDRMCKCKLAPISTNYEG